MRTARLLTVSQHAQRRGVCIPACTGWRCVSQHALGRGGICPGGCLPRGSLPGVYPSMHWVEVCIPACTGQGGYLPRRVSAQRESAGGVCPGGCLQSGCLSGGGVCPGGCLPLVLGRGVCVVCVSQYAMGQTPPCGQTDTCENTTFAASVCGR